MYSQVKHIFRKFKQFKLWKPKEDLWEHPFKRKDDEQKHPPVPDMFVLLDFLNKCNLRCIMCGNSNQTNEPEVVIDRKSFEKIAEAVFPLSRQVNLSCGYEPFVFPGIFDYVEIALKYPIPKLTLVTNATLLNRTRVERIVALGLPYLAISVDGATKETYESIRIGAEFEKLLENLRSLRQTKEEMHREKPRIQFNFVLMDKNLEEISLFIHLMSYFKPYKFVFVHHNFATPTGEQRLKIELTLKQALAECVAHKVLFEEVPSFCLTLEEIIQAYGCSVKNMPEVIHRCSDPWHFMRITPRGDVLMCPNIGEPAGNIFQSDVMDIWHGEIYNNLRAQLHNGISCAQCQSCPYSNIGLVQLRQVRDRIEQLITQQISPSPAGYNEDA